MSETDLTQKLEALLARAREAHGQNDADPDWPIGYAEHLLEPLREMLSPRLTKSRIAYCLIAAEDERRALAPGSNGIGHNAKRLKDCFASAEHAADDTLALYQFDGCPFCRRVRQAIDSLGVDVEIRDVRLSDQYRDELLEERGRATVPVLRITHADGRDRWMPESADIVAYLEETYG